jgi:glutamyl-tRNA synthetase
MVVRTRFAPSPTGYVHIGSLRTALFCWLWARHNGGTFVLRIEDTDRDPKRLVLGAVDHLKNALRLMGLPWDEGPDVGGPHAPYVQSERLPIYAAYADRLLKAGHFYKCWCDKKNNDEIAAGNEKPVGYDGHCRHLSAQEKAELEASDKPYVLRLAVPNTGHTVCNDFLRGKITFKNWTLSDPIMMKSDGYPMYNFAVVVDDHEMGITHVMRGDEYVSSMPINAMLYDLLGIERPIWVHLPVVLGKDGEKLSKRNGDVSLDWYLDQGYLPEALINILALTGWGWQKGHVVATIDEFVAGFDVKRIQKASGKFDVDKLNTFNRGHIRRLSPSEFVRRLTPFLVKEGFIAEALTPEQEAVLIGVAPMLQKRIKMTLTEPENIDYIRPFFVAPAAITVGVLLDAQPPEIVAAGKAVTDALAALPNFDHKSIEECLRQLGTDTGLGTALFTWPRIAITGTTNALPLFESLSLLGKDESLKRLNAALRS